MRIHRFKTVSIAVLSVVMLLAVPVFSHGTVDQQFSGPFSVDLGINATGGIAQGFTPTTTNVGAVDIFLDGSGSAPSIPLTINLRDGAFNGPILGSSTVVLPAGITGSPASPYTLHVDFATPIPVVPGNQYYIQVDPDGGFYGAASAFGDPYPGGQGYQGDFNCCGLDIGFRTYFVVPAPTSKNDCKDGGWMRFTSPSFKNQGDCIQYVNTGK